MLENEFTKKHYSVKNLPLAVIVPDPDQPRRDFDETKLRELAESIKQQGLLQPILVRPLEDGQFQIVHGERRYRACKRLGLNTIKAEIRKLDDKQVLEIQLVENLQREDLNPIEEAETFKRLIDKFGYTHEQIAKKIGKSREYVSNKLRLLDLPNDLQRGIRRGNLSEGHGRTLVSLGDPTIQRMVCQEISAKKLSVRETEELVRSLRERSDVSRETFLASPNAKTLLIPISSNVFAIVDKVARKMKIKPEDLIQKAVDFFLRHHRRLLDKSRRH